ncbi:DUF6771 family protein [Sphingomonas faeni]|uniref:DUF6771 family protein n=1 Tax=Sphingomonas faeni TaxID=185950 RepID=UPI0035940BAB
MAGIITADRIADLIDQSPDWALAGLTSSQERLRADARREVARHVYDALYHPLCLETAQLPLPL